MARIVARDATPESVLDHGFDPALGAREAMRGRAREIAPEPPKGISAAVARLREIARLGDAGLSDAPLRGLEGEVMAEIVGASILRNGQAPAARDRLALESHVAAIADPREWRGMLRQSPSGTVQEADALAVELAGTVPGDSSGRAPTAARILARGALTARALGEDAVADLFEDGLRLYGRRAAMARALGRPEELVANPGTEEEVRAERAREAADRGAASGAGGPHVASATHRTRRRSRGLDVTRMLDELDTSDERLAEEAFEIFVPKGRKRRPARRQPRRYERCAAALRLGGDWPERAEAVNAAREEMEAGRAAEVATAAPEERPDPERRERAGADPDLALQLAMAVTARTPMAAAVHAQDLQKGISSLLERADGGDADPVAGIARLAARGDAERELVAAVGEAAAAGPLPEAGALRSARSDLLAELSLTGVSPEPQPDLGERITKCFTQGEILALHDARRPLPESLPKLGRDARRDVALHLQTFAPLDDPAKRPEPDPLPVMGSILARPEGRGTFSELARSLSLDQMQALRDPDTDLPEGLGGLGRDGRKRIAEAFRTGPVPGREDTAPDPRFADDVLVLSCAVSERVDAADSVHRGTLPLDVEQVLKASSLARDVPEAEVDELAFGIARRRAETELRVEVARGIGRTAISVVKARFLGNPEYTRQADIDDYKAGVAMGMRRLHREEPVPTGLELRVARAVVATHGSERHRLALAMAEALERGRPEGADTIRMERAALPRELARGTVHRNEKEERRLTRRIYGNFTGAEIREMCEGRGQVLKSLPDDGARRRIREGLLNLHRDTSYPEPSPWRGLHAALSRTYGAEREQDPERGRYRGLGAEIEL